MLNGNREVMENQPDRISHSEGHGQFIAYILVLD